MEDANCCSLSDKYRNENSNEQHHGIEASRTRKIKFKLVSCDRHNHIRSNIIYSFEDTRPKVRPVQGPCLPIVRFFTLTSLADSIPLLRLYQRPPVY
jgi:hypothetical protein